MINIKPEAMADYRLVSVEQIQRAVHTLERYANDTLLGRNTAYELRELLCSAPKVQEEPDSHDWDDQDKCRRCGDRDWYASATCTPKQRPLPDVAELQAELDRERQRRFDGNEQASREHREDVKLLVDALESIMGYIPLDVVHCRGDKCRELWCASCFGDEEAETYLVTAARHLKNAKYALSTYRNQGGEK